MQVPWIHRWYIIMRPLGNCGPHYKTATSTVALSVCFPAQLSVVTQIVPALTLLHIPARVCLLQRINIPLLTTQATDATQQQCNDRAHTHIHDARVGRMHIPRQHLAIQPAIHTVARHTRWGQRQLCLCNAEMANPCPTNICVLAVPCDGTNPGGDGDGGSSSSGG